MPAMMNSVEANVPEPMPWPDISVRVDEVMAHSLFVGGIMKPGSKEGRLMKRGDYWHTFVIVGGCKYYRDFVLKLIIEAAYPFDFIPVKYQKVDPDSCFLVKNCPRAIEQLCRIGLVVHNPHGESIRLQLVLASLHQSACTVNINETVRQVLMKRFDSKLKVLNLKDFHNDPDLGDIFYPLSQPPILMHINDQIMSVLALPQHFVSLSLANNELSSMRSLEPLTVFALKLRSLNLSYNKFDEIGDLEVLRRIPLNELSLDNNPLCQRFDTETGYIKKVREYFPAVKVLDGITLNKSGLPLTRQNFLALPTAGPLVDQFLQHYFNLYDFDRVKLAKCYHERALFSLTATYIPGQTTSVNACLGKYITESRNLLKLSDYSKASLTLHCGRADIIGFLRLLPATEHDPYSFSVDASVYTGESAVVSVSGVYQEPLTVGLVRTFNRVFVLVRAGPREWQIANDSLSVNNARNVHVEQAFKVARSRPGNKSKPMGDGDRKQLAEIVSQITDMNYSSSYKCLEDAKWNLEDAITAFTDMYKAGKVPTQAFVKLDGPSLP